MARIAKRLQVCRITLRAAVQDPNDVVDHLAKLTDPLLTALAAQRLIDSMLAPNALPFRGAIELMFFVFKDTRSTLSLNVP